MYIEFIHKIFLYLTFLGNWSLRFFFFLIFFVLFHFFSIKNTVRKENIDYFTFFFKLCYIFAYMTSFAMFHTFWLNNASTVLETSSMGRILCYLIYHKVKEIIIQTRRWGEYLVQELIDSCVMIIKCIIKNFQSQCFKVGDINKKCTKNVYIEQDF